MQREIMLLLAEWVIWRTSYTGSMARWVESVWGDKFLRIDVLLLRVHLDSSWPDRVMLEKLRL
jgi:hypothetical protein